MKKENNKKSKSLASVAFAGGLIIYLAGLFMILASSLSNLTIIKKILIFLSLSRQSLSTMRNFGIILFFVGFIIFIWSLIILYKNNEVFESNRNLIIEGKADVITIVIMTYVLIFMLVICLLFNELIGALLFGITLVVQNIVNSMLIKYYTKYK